jgi:hypothetical protein
MDNTQMTFWTGFAFVILGFFAAVMFTVGTVSAIQVNIAYGYNLSFSDSNAPYYIVIPSSQVIGDLSNLNTTADATANNSTAKCQAWLFGEHTYITPVPFTTHMSYYTVEIPASVIQSMPEGDYNMYLQFPGQTGVMSLQYNAGVKQLGSPFRNYEPVSLVGLTPRLAEDAFVRAQQGTTDYGDTFYKVPVTIGKPSIVVTDNYVLHNGDLYIGGTTNLAKGDYVSGTIDPDIYVSPNYHRMMTDLTVVTGDANDYRNWHLEYSQNLSSQLPIGHHEVIVDLGQDVKYSVPFQKWQDPVTPTPTPEIRDIYGINGEWMGRKVNTTAPTETPTPTPTVNQTYETVLMKFRLNNRTVDNRGDVYIGEKNLDIRGAIGWMQPNGDWMIQYCDYYGNDWNKTIVIPDPKHFDISKDTFLNDYGAWCQYSPFEAGKARQPVAFWVKAAGPEPTPNITALRENLTINATPTEDVLNVTITPGQNVTITGIPPTTEPMASDTIVVPLPWWVTVAAVVGVVLWKRN